MSRMECARTGCENETDSEDGICYVCHALANGSREEIYEEILERLKRLEEHFGIKEEE